MQAVFKKLKVFFLLCSSCFLLSNGASAAVVTQFEYTQLGFEQRSLSDFFAPPSAIFPNAVLSVTFTYVGEPLYQPEGLSPSNIYESDQLTAILLTFSSPDGSFISSSNLSELTSGGAAVVSSSGIFLGFDLAPSSGLLGGEGVSLVSSFAGRSTSIFGVGDIGYFSTGEGVITQVVPIPAGVWLFGSVLIGLAGIKRKRC